MERDRDSALDLVGETLLAAWENFDALRDDRAFLSWLLTIARRIHGEKRRRRKLFREDEPGYADALVWEGPQPDVLPDFEALFAALSTLPEKQREAVVLFELTGFSLREIQEMQGGSISALKVRLHRGRKRLARLLGADRTDAPDSRDTVERNPDVHPKNQSPMSASGGMSHNHESNRLVPLP